MPVRRRPKAICGARGMDAGWKATGHGPQVLHCAYTGTVDDVAVSTEDLRAIAARVRAEAAAAGELTPSKVGAIHWDVPDGARQAILDDLASGVYEEAAREATAADPEMTQL